MVCQLIVKFLSDLVEEKELSGAFSGLKVKDFYRLQGYAFEHEEDATIIIDNMLNTIKCYFNDGFEKYSYDYITHTCIHELIHSIGRWYPEEWDGLVYESPVDDLVKLMMEMLEE